VSAESGPAAADGETARSDACVGPDTSDIAHLHNRSA
jgi:hypothetical protein